MGNSSDKPLKVSLRSLTAVLAALVVAGLGLVFVYQARLAFGLIVVSTLLAVALNHLVQVLQRRGIPRGAAIALLFTVGMSALALAAAEGLPAIAHQARELMERIPVLFSQVRESRGFQRLDHLLNLSELIKRGEQDWSEQLRGTAGPTWRVASSLVSIVASIVSVFFLTLFMLLFGGQLLRAALDEVTPATRVRHRRILAKLDQAIGGYLSGISIICSVNATLTGLMLAIVQVPSFLPLALISGASSMVPYAGPVVVGTGVTLLTLLTGGLWKALAVAIFYLLYGQLEGNVLAPLVFRRTAKVNPLVSLMAVLVFGELWGVVGAMASVPIAAMSQVLVRELLVLRRERLALPLTGPAGSTADLSERERSRLAEEERAHREAEQASPPH